MRTRAGLAIAVLAALAAGCARAQSRDLAPYYDPQGLFSADLPAANHVSVTPARSGQGASAILSGVVAAPPLPSPSPESQLGGSLSAVAQQETPSDRTLYEVLVVTTEAFPSLDDMVLSFLTQDPATDVREDRPIAVGSTDGRLVVVDIRQGGSTTASLAAAFTLGTDGVGYIVAALFPPGDWPREQADFARIVGSLRPSVPTGLQSFPLGAG